jgi:ubiquinone/menaquinone biosynthesis C-methylase UbiE
LTASAGEGPDAARARAAYARIASEYDRRLSLRLSAPVQRRAVTRLAPAPGARVLDVACGTGLNFEAIEAQIGSKGQLVGVDLSEEMLAIAAQRVRGHGWSNVELIQSPIEEMELDARCDAALFSFTHDVLRSKPAVDRVIAALRPGARVAAAGVKLAPRWAVPLNATIRIATRHYVTTLEGLERPWSHLEPHLIDATLEPMYVGSMYVVSGHRR